MIKFPLLDARQEGNRNDHCFVFISRIHDIWNVGRRSPY